MGNSKVWLFRGLVIVAAGLMVVSWILPWWGADAADIGKNVVIIHPYGLEQHLGEFAVYIAGSEMPVWFAPLMWTYLGLCIAALLFSLFASEKRVGLGKFKLSLPKLLIGGVGLSYIIVAVVAIIVAAIRTGAFDLPLQGSTSFTVGPERVSIDASLRFGYYMAYAVGLSCIALALLRDKIIGKPKLENKPEK